MWTKKDCMEAAARGEGCLGKARDDEPVFVLVGDDATMAYAVRCWAERVRTRARNARLPIPDKVRGALLYANEIEAWQAHNLATVKEPD